MSRQRRRDHPGAVQHVMVRTLPELPLLFRDDDDRRSFTLRLARVAQEEDYRLLAVALMPNHAHIVGQTGRTPLWRVMKRLGSGYASTYNRRHGRRGYVLEDRYRSKLVSTPAYLETVVCYVLLNPLRGRVVSSLDELESYPWTSLPALLGSAFPLFTEVGATLSIFGSSRDVARHVLRERLRAIVSAGAIEPLSFDRDGGDDAALTQLDDEIAQFARSQFQRTADQLRRATRIRATWTVDDVLKLACETAGVKRQTLKNDRTAPSADVRAIAAHLLVDELGIQASAVASILHIGRPAVSKAIRRGRTRASECGVTLDGARKSPKVA